MQSCTTERAVDTERTILVDIEHQSRTELVIHIAYGQFTKIEGSIQTQMTQSVAREIGLIARHRPAGQFAPDVGLQTMEMVGIGVVEIMDRQIDIGLATIVPGLMLQQSLVAHRTTDIDGIACKGKLKGEK